MRFFYNDIFYYNRIYKTEVFFNIKIIEKNQIFFLDGPGSNKLMNGDEILAVNDEDVELASRNYVINLIRSCNDKIKLMVKQPTVTTKIF